MQTRRNREFSLYYLWGWEIMVTFAVQRNEIDTMRYDEIIADGERLMMPVAENYRDCVELIKSDAYRHHGKRLSLLKIWLMSWTRTSVSFSFWWRLAQHKGWLYPLCKWRVKSFKSRYGLLIPTHVRIGWGFYLQHCCGLVIHREAIIGNNVHMGQFTTVGSSNLLKASVICNNVYLGPNVCVVDEIVLHSHSTVGAGAVVTRNVASHTTVAGVPAKVIQEHDHPELLRFPWPVEEQ